MKINVTVDEIMGGKNKLPIEADNLCNLMVQINRLRDWYGKQFIITSGYRDEEHNKRVGGAKNSAHLTCEAVDIQCEGLSEELMKNPWVLEKFDLWMEHPSQTPTWVHLQIRPTKSGNRIFFK